MTATLELWAVWAWEMIWVPVLVWSALASLVLLALKTVPATYLRVHRDVLTALMLALPAGLVLGQILPAPRALNSTPLPKAADATTFWGGSGVESVGATDPAGLGLLAVAGMVSAILIAAGLFSLLRHWEAVRALQGLVRRSRSYHGLRPDTISTAGMDVRIAAGTRVPFSAGLRQPTIVLPVHGPEDARLAIAHEAVHHHEQDVARMLAARLIAALFVFHPLVQWILHRLALAVEKVCDRQVLQLTGSPPHAYAELLLSYVPTGRPRHAVLMGRTHSELKQRIAAMNTIPRGSRPVSLLLSVVLLTVLSVAVACSQADPTGALDDVDMSKTYEISGIVKDQASGSPLAGASVLLEGTQVGSATDPSGAYTIRHVPPGEYTVVVSYVGRPNLRERVVVPMDVESRVATENEALRHNPVLPIMVDGAGASLQGQRIGNRELERVLKTLGKDVVVSMKVDPSTPVGVVRDLEQIMRNNVTGSFRVGAAKSAMQVPTRSDDPETFVVVEQMPELVGGLKAVQSRIRYPELAKQAGIEGRVIVQFTVDEEGAVLDPVVVRGIGGGCDEEALRAVQDIRFKPGKQRGRNVKVKMSLPVTFALDGSA